MPERTYSGEKQNFLVITFEMLKYITRNFRSCVVKFDIYQILRPLNTFFFDIIFLCVVIYIWINDYELFPLILIQFKEEWTK